MFAFKFYLSDLSWSGWVSFTFLAVWCDRWGYFGKLSIHSTTWYSYSLSLLSIKPFSFYFFQMISKYLCFSCSEGTDWRDGVFLYRTPCKIKGDCKRQTIVDKSRPTQYACICEERNQEQVTFMSTFEVFSFFLCFSWFFSNYLVDGEFSQNVFVWERWSMKCCFVSLKIHIFLCVAIWMMGLVLICFKSITYLVTGREFLKIHFYEFFFSFLSSLFDILFLSVQCLLGSAFTSKRMLLPILTKKKFVSPEMQYSCVFNDFVGHCITKVCPFSQNSFLPLDSYTCWLGACWSHFCE